MVQQRRAFYLLWKISTIFYFVFVLLIIKFVPVGYSENIKIQNGDHFDFRPKIFFNTFLPNSKEKFEKLDIGILDLSENVFTGLNPNLVFLPNISFYQEKIPGHISEFVNVVSHDISNIAGINLKPGSKKITLKINPGVKDINRGKSFRISFFPGQKCTFGDKRACVYTFNFSENTRIIFLTIHSGVGGEAQNLRHILEGTGIDRAGYSLATIKTKMTRLTGSSASLEQGEKEFSDLTIEHVTRIPAKHLAKYFTLPIEKSLDYAGRVDPLLHGDLLPGQTYIVVETCGWKHPGEKWAKGVSPTSGSVYLVVFSFESG